MPPGFALPPARRARVDEGCLLLELPGHIILHILLQLATADSDHHARRDSLSALCLKLVESSDYLWDAMGRHPARERRRKLQKHVEGRYGAGEHYSYSMQLCDFPNSKIWQECAENEFAPGHVVANPELLAHFAVAGSPDRPVVDSERSDWILGDVAGPWRMRIVAKATRNLIAFSEVCSDDTPGSRWVILCSAVLNAHGTRMEGVWMQARDGNVVATFVERRPDGSDHVEWY
ncbi:hypothetical protein T492DRAFT_939686 [Pavlovales sp. CCMP2436]|nr:hypothetical protein T492DRAFT_939686 [Pavlovales sp. CCMP2436]